MNSISPKWFPVIVATSIAFIVLAWYLATGRGSLDKSARELANNKDISEINTANPQNIQITCDNGEKYEIMFTQGQGSYDELVFNACGAQGELQDTSRRE